MENPDGDRGSVLVRCASQSSLDESSQVRAREEGGGGGGGGAGGAAGGEPRGGHAAKLLEALAGLQRERALCDVVLYARPEAPPPCVPAGLPAEGSGADAAEGAGDADANAGECGEGVAAHRAVLAACSPYFRAMFTQFDERTQQTVTIQNVEPHALRSIVEWMYAPESLVITEHNVQALLGAASLLAAGGVRAACCAWLAAALQPDNALGVRAFAELHACHDLAAAAATYLDRHFLEVVESEEFLALEADDVCALLAGEGIWCGARGEEAVLDAALRWAAGGAGAGAGAGRAAQLARLLRHVRLPLLPRDVLVARATQPPLDAAEVEVKDLVIEALSFHLLRGERRLAAAAACPRARPRRPPRAPKMILVVGGQAPKAIRGVEAWDAEGETWLERCPLPARRCRAGLAAAGGRVWAVGGFNGTLRVRTVDVYDPATDTWAPGPSMNHRRSTLGVAVLHGVIYAVGGFDGATGLASCERLAPGDAAWAPLPDMGGRRSSVGVAAHRGRVYAVGGYDGASRQCLHSVERYLPGDAAWEAAAPLGARRSGAGVAELGGALWAAGGHDGPAVRRSVERYEEGGGWAPAPPMRAARRNAGVLALAGRLYVVGGDDGHANLDSVEVFDPATGAWTELEARMAVGRSYAGVCVVDRP